MKNGILITNTIYKVDEVNKVVVCTLKCDLQMHKKIDWYIDSTRFIKYMPYVRRSGTFTVTGKARCNSSDVFDAELGKKIAESRAKAKMFKTGCKVWALISEYFEDNMNACLERAAACAFAEEHEQEHISELCK